MCVCVCVCVCARVYEREIAVSGRKDLFKKITFA